MTDSQLWKEHWGEAKVEEREAVRKVGLEPRLSRSRDENTDSYTEPEMGSRDLQRDTLAQYSVIESHYSDLSFFQKNFLGIFANLVC